MAQPKPKPKPKRPLDRYDYMGFAVVALIAALWIAHFVMPDTGPAAPV